MIGRVPSRDGDSRRDTRRGADYYERTMLAAFVTTVLFALSAVCGSRTARTLGGTEANFWRLVLATLALGIYGHGWGPGLSGAAFPWFLWSGCVGFGLGDVAFFQALPRLGARLTAMMVTCLSAPLAALIEWQWLGTALTLAQALCGLLILAGVGLALAPTRGEAGSAGHSTAGIVFGLLAAAGQGGGAVLSRRAFAVAEWAGENLDGLSAAYQRIVGGVAVAALFLVLIKGRSLWRAGRPEACTTGEWRRLPACLNPSQTAAAWPSGPSAAARAARWRRVWPWLLANALAGPALGVGCFQWALKTTPTGVVLAIVALTPIVAIPFARVVEGERPSGRSLVGGAMAVAAAVALALING